MKAEEAEHITSVYLQLKAYLQVGTRTAWGRGGSKWEGQPAEGRRSQARPTPPLPRRRAFTWKTGWTSWSPRS